MPMSLGGYSVTSIVVTSCAVLGLSAFGGFITDTGPWYQALRKPWYQPPDYLFAPAWSLIFLGLAAAIVLAWNAPAATDSQRARLLVAAVTNGALNALWSALFFAFRRPDFALVEVLALWLSIAALIVVVYPMSTTAGWLLAPYLAWVTFAAVLNYGVVALNAPFSQS